MLVAAKEKWTKQKNFFVLFLLINKVQLSVIFADAPTSILADIMFATQWVTALTKTDNMFQDQRRNIAAGDFSCQGSEIIWPMTSKAINLIRWSVMSFALSIECKTLKP